MSLAASLRGLEMGVFAPFVGFLADRFGSRKVVISGIITVGLGYILLGFTQSLAVFYASLLLIAFGAGGCTTAVTTTAVANWFDKRVGIALGVMASGIGAGGLMVPVVVRFIDLFQWRNTSIILGLGAWILGIPLSCVIRNKPELYGFLPDGESFKGQISRFKKQSKEVEIGIKAALKKRCFLYLNIAEAIRLMTIAAVFTHVMPYLGSIGMPRANAGLIACAIPLFGIIGRFGFGWLGDVFDKRHVMALAFSLVGLGMLAFAYLGIRWVIFPFFLFFALGHGGSMVIRGAILREYFGRNSFGKILGINMGFGAIGGIIGPTLAGWVFDSMGAYHLVWLIFCGLVGLTAILIMRIK